MRPTDSFIRRVSEVRGQAGFLVIEVCSVVFERPNALLRGLTVSPKKERHSKLLLISRIGLGKGKFFL